MSSAFDSFDSSPLKAFVQSPLKARNRGRAEFAVSRGLKIFGGFLDFGHLPFPSPASNCVPFDGKQGQYNSQLNLYQQEDFYNSVTLQTINGLTTFFVEGAVIRNADTGRLVTKISGRSDPDLYPVREFPVVGPADSPGGIESYYFNICETLLHDTSYHYIDGFDAEQKLQLSAPVRFAASFEEANGFAKTRLNYGKSSTVIQKNVGPGTGNGTDTQDNIQIQYGINPSGIPRKCGWNLYPLQFNNQIGGEAAADGGLISADTPLTEASLKNDYNAKLLALAYPTFWPIGGQTPEPSVLPILNLITKAKGLGSGALVKYKGVKDRDLNDQTVLVSCQQINPGGKETFFSPDEPKDDAISTWTLFFPNLSCKNIRGPYDLWP